MARRRGPQWRGSPRRRAANPPSPGRAGEGRSGEARPRRRLGRDCKASPRRIRPSLGERGSPGLGQRPATVTDHCAHHHRPFPVMVGWRQQQRGLPRHCCNFF
ncbi:hypothetical protein NL676_012944 [Syzygium grande]|nr:hypothetical protein NL676_012944 [Syzygium grande]